MLHLLYPGSGPCHAALCQLNILVRLLRAGERERIFAHPLVPGSYYAEWLGRLAVGHNITSGHLEITPLRVPNGLLPGCKMRRVAAPHHVLLHTHHNAAELPSKVHRTGIFALLQELWLDHHPYQFGRPLQRPSPQFHRQDTSPSRYNSRTLVKRFTPLGFAGRPKRRFGHITLALSAG